MVVNTCAVTAEAVRQARQTHPHAARANARDAKIVVTGCAAQTEPQTFVAMAEVDRVLGNEEKLSAAAWTRTAAAFGLDDAPKAVVNDIMAVDETAAHLIDAIDGRTRAFVQVQNGCDHRCTFCIIPVRPRQFALGADGRGGRRRCGGSSPTATARSCSPASISPATAPPAGRAEARHAGEADPQARAGARAAAAVVDRFGRSRRATCSTRSRTSRG